MVNYTHQSIVLNNRMVSIVDICSNTVIPTSDFEEGVLRFIRHWFQGKKVFEQSTSGSTGSPKVIEITREQMETSAKLSQQALGLHHDYHALVCLSTDYIAGKMMLVRCFVTGMRILAITPSGNPFQDIQQDQRVDFTALVPAQVHDILKSEYASWFQDLKTVIIGGAPLDASTEMQLQSLTCPFFATYGMTETMSHVALRKLNGKDASPYYTMLPGIEISTDDRHCLVIHWNNLGEPLVTNDIVEIVHHNTFRWVGRWDHAINSGGVKIIPEQLEAKIRNLLHTEGINVNFFVTQMSDIKFGEQVVLVVEGRSLQVDWKKQMTTFRGVLSPPEVPREIRAAPTFVLTPNGKINRTKTLAEALPIDV